MKYFKKTMSRKNSTLAMLIKRRAMTTSNWSKVIFADQGKINTFGSDEKNLCLEKAETEKKSYIGMKQGDRMVQIRFENV